LRLLAWRQPRARFGHNIDEFAADYNGISHQTNFLCALRIANPETYTNGQRHVFANALQTCRDIGRI
jgi:hypothetical protein